VGPRVDLVDLGTTKILPTRIQNLDHPAHGIDAMLTMITKLQLGTGRDGPALADLPPWKETLYPPHRRLGGPQGQSQLEEKI